MRKESWSPEQYEKFKKERSQPFYDLMNLIEKTSAPHVVDLGCGTGELTSELHDYLSAGETLGIDSSEAMLKEAHQFSRPGLSFQKADIQNWNPQKQYDIIFSNAALQWCTDHPKIFENLKNSLSENGQLLIQMPMNHDYPTHLLASQMSLEEPWASLLKKERYQKTILSPEEYAELLFRLGFTEQKVFLRVYAHLLESREDVIEWVKGTLLTHFQARLIENDYQKFLGEFKARLFDVLPDNKPFFYPFKRLLLWARTSRASTLY